MLMKPSDITIAIPTYGRDAVLLETVRQLAAQDPAAGAVLVVDQTVAHDAQTTRQLQEWHQEGRIQWIRLERPSVVIAMNTALRVAVTTVVLFVDDDIIPAPGLVAAHAAAYEAVPEAWAVAGQVLQPGDTSKDVQFRGLTSGLTAFETFSFFSRQAQWIGNVMAGNLSVKRVSALEVGGFDENFIPPVAYRFETEFAHRLLAAGGRIWFEPRASLRHLRAVSGGTRSLGSHLTSASPLHGVGDYYYALRCGRGWERLVYMVRRPFREVRTRFHLGHPWWIPVKFIGELRALALALRLFRKGPKLLEMP